jgi:hypothetical protein
MRRYGIVRPDELFPVSRRGASAEWCREDGPQ